MPNETDGIMIDLISREKLADMEPKERIRFIVDEVKNGKVLVLERGLTAVEEMELIKVTMANIDQESFVGVETPGFSLSARKRGFFQRILGKKQPPRMMVVGPANLLKTIRKDGKVVQAMLLAKGGLRPMREEEAEGSSTIKPPKGNEVEEFMDIAEPGAIFSKGMEMPPPPGDSSLAPTGLGREVAKEVPKETPKETPKDVDKNVPGEEIKASPKDEGDEEEIAERPPGAK